MDKLKETLAREHTWFVTGCAGFIGSSITEFLLNNGQIVRGLDNLSTGHQANIDDVKRLVGAKSAARFTFFDGDINDTAILKNAMKGAEFVSHQAALGSVPRSIDEPALTARSNVEGFVNIAKTAADLGISRVVYASSSSVYGDVATSPKVEEDIGYSLSPYAASKLSDEIFAQACSSVYDVDFIGLRYFNVFGLRQDPQGAYAAVIPKWLMTLLNGEKAIINGDPCITRDYTHIDNAVLANMLALTADQSASNQVYNIANGIETSLADLHTIIVDHLFKRGAIKEKQEPVIGPPRPGDVSHSLASISKAAKMLDYKPKVDVFDGLKKTVEWYCDKSVK